MNTTRPLRAVGAPRSAGERSAHLARAPVAQLAQEEQEVQLQPVEAEHRGVLELRPGVLEPLRAGGVLKVVLGALVVRRADARLPVPLVPARARRCRGAAPGRGRRRSGRRAGAGLLLVELDAPFDEPHPRDVQPRHIRHEARPDLLPQRRLEAVVVGVVQEAARGPDVAPEDLPRQHRAVRPPAVRVGDRRPRRDVRPLRGRAVRVLHHRAAPGYLARRPAVLVDRLHRRARRRRRLAHEVEDARVQRGGGESSAPARDGLPLAFGDGLPLAFGPAAGLPVHRTGRGLLRDVLARQRGGDVEERVVLPRAPLLQRAQHAAHGEVPGDLPQLDAVHDNADEHGRDPDCRVRGAGVRGGQRCQRCARARPCLTSGARETYSGR